MKEDLVKLNINDLLECIKNPDTKVNHEPYNNANDEFKKYVDKTVSDRRKSSSIINMRDYHNWIKATLINNVCNYYYSIHHKKINLLDIAVGRGGDIKKWINTRSGKTQIINKVFGFDSDVMSIESKDPFNQGAKERLKNIKRSNVDIHFEVGNAFRPTIPLLDNIISFSPDGYQVVSCQFAMHYFFKEKGYLDTVFKIVNRFLVQGGYFIGTILDETKIRDPENQKGVLYNLNPIQPFKDRAPYGNGYTFEILDSGDEGNYFNTLGISTEYLVHQKEFEKVAKEHNLVPDRNFFENYNINGKKDYSKTKTPFNSFQNIIKYWTPRPGGEYLNENELKLNNLYTTFVFKKN
jgi:mRNA (guanine-N7-)-methyltransferase